MRKHLDGIFGKLNSLCSNDVKFATVLHQENEEQKSPNSVSLVESHLP